MKIGKYNYQHLSRILAGCACIILCSKIKIQHEGMVLFTFQTLAIVINNYWLRNEESLWSLCVYFILGLTGFEVFAGKTAGLEILKSPHVGFLTGFFVATIAGNQFKNKFPKFNFIHAVTYTSILHLIILTSGYAYLYFYLNNPGKTVIALTQTLPGMVYKIAIGTVFIGFANHKEQ